MRILLIWEGLDEDLSNNKNIKNNKEKLNMLYVKSKSRLIFAPININSIRSKFEDLKLLIQDNVDILVVTETKLDDTFTSAQFYMEGFKTIKIFISILRHKELFPWT